MLYIDLKYLNFVSSKLTGFVRKKDHVWNFRCPLCGDSKKDIKKKRAYVFSWKNSLTFHCHNCGATHSFYELLEILDSYLFDQYKIELFKEKYGNSNISRNKKEEEFLPPKQDTLSKLEENASSIEKVFYSICKPISELPDDHNAVKYCLERKIPKIQFPRLFYIDDTRNLIKLKPDLNIPYGEERLVLPFFDKCGKLIGITCRALDKKTKLRYLTVKLTEHTQVFGMDKVDPTKRIYVVEGPLDSLFLPNSIAVTGTAFGKVESVLKDLNIAPDQVVLILDNQPRNKEVCKIQSKLIDIGYSLVVWDIDDSEGKDINDLVTGGKYSMRDVGKIIKRCITRGLEARMKFNNWRKC